MRFSRQIHYAIYGVFDLAYNGRGEAVQVRVISERQSIPTRYLEQIFQRLRRAEIVSGKRGPGERVRAESGARSPEKMPRECQGPGAKARARATRCCSPPESCEG